MNCEIVGKNWSGENSPGDQMGVQMIELMRENIKVAGGVARLDFVWNSPPAISVVMASDAQDVSSSGFPSRQAL